MTLSGEGLPGEGGMGTETRLEEGGAGGESMEEGASAMREHIKRGGLPRHRKWIAEGGGA